MIWVGILKGYNLGWEQTGNRGSHRHCKTKTKITQNKGKILNIFNSQIADILRYLAGVNVSHLHWIVKLF